MVKDETGEVSYEGQSTPLKRLDFIERAFEG